MKRILLIEDGRPFWPRIKELLAKVNAVVDEQLLGELGAAAERKPDLLVVGENYYASRPPGWWDGPLLVLEKGRPADAVAPLDAGMRRMIASSSIDERGFLSLTSRLLGVSERRLFCAVVGVKRVGQGHAHMGASREFSLTGLSFSLPVELAPGERVVITFFVPGAGRRVALAAEVMRSFPAPEDGALCHGARFVDLAAEERELLKRFVWAEV